MSILFERKVESGNGLPDGHVRITTGVTTGVPEDPQVTANDRLDLLEDEVDHLRACIDQLLDMVDAQNETGDVIELLSDRMSIFERRMQRVEDGLSIMHRTDKRRAGED